MTPRKDIIFNIFDEKQRILFFKYINLYYLYVNNEEMRSMEQLESFYIDFDSLFNFIKTLNLPENMSPYILASAIYNTKKEFYEKKQLNKSEEALKRKGRLPTKKVQVTKKTSDGRFITYRTTVYVKPERLNVKLRRIGMIDSYKRFLASKYYNEQTFKKYKRKYDLLLKQNKIHEIGKLMEKYFEEIKVHTMGKYTKNKKMWKQLLNAANRAKYNLMKR